MVVSFNGFRLDIIFSPLSFTFVQQLQMEVENLF